MGAGKRKQVDGIKTYTSEQNERLANAVLRNDLDSAREALKADADPDTVCSDILGAPPVLVMASWLGNLNMTLLLAEHGADFEKRDACGRTALMAASAIGALNIVYTLLVRDAETNAQDNGGATALYYAAYFGHADVTRALKKAEADMNICGPEGTPLMVALNNGHSDAADALVFSRKKLARLVRKQTALAA